MGYVGSASGDNRGPEELITSSKVETIVKSGGMGVTDDVRFKIVAIASARDTLNANKKWQYLLAGLGVLGAAVTRIFGGDGMQEFWPFLLGTGATSGVIALVSDIWEGIKEYKVENLVEQVYKKWMDRATQDEYIGMRDG